MVYLYIQLKITNPDVFAQYKEVAAAALKTHGCEIVLIGRDNQILDGNWAVPDAAVILRFPDKAAAQAWMDDPDLAETHALRRKSGDLSIVLAA